MQFCDKLLTEINFEPHALSPCCNTGNREIPAFPYNGGPIDLSAYARHIEDTISSLQADTTLCRNCSHLKNVDQLPGMSGQFSAVSINMHRFFCNCKCVYCGLWKTPEKGKGYDVLPGLKSLAEQNALANNCFLSWGGGESSILPSFEEATRWIMAKGYTQHTHTNALKFSDALAESLSAKKGLMTVSLDSGNRKTYERVKGVDGFDKVYANLQKYASLGPDSVILKYIVFAANNSLRDIKDFFDIVGKLKIRNIELSFNFIEINGNSLSEKTIMAAAYFCIYAKTHNLNLSPFFIPPKWHAKLNARIEELTGPD